MHQEFLPNSLQVGEIIKLQTNTQRSYFVKFDGPPNYEKYDSDDEWDEGLQVH